jgi:hypothetical protein
MSLTDAQQFLIEVENNPELKEYVASAHWDMAHVFAAAEYLNLSFTEEELGAAFDQMWGIISE